MKKGVLLLAEGAPEREEDLEEFLNAIRGGWPGMAETADELRRRYQAIGGASPLVEWTRRQAAALAQMTGLPVFFAMRHWRPSIRDAVEEILRQEVNVLAALFMASQFADATLDLYRKRTEAALLQAGARFTGWSADDHFTLVWTRTPYREPHLIHAFADRLLEFQERGGPLNEMGRRVLLTGQSLPDKILPAQETYARQCAEMAASVASQAGIDGWDFAYQGQGRAGGRWLGPTVEAQLDRYAAEGIKDVILMPIGFFCDRLETLYDIDIRYRDYAGERGMQLTRPEALNGSYALTCALSSAAWDRLANVYPIE